MSDVEPRKQPRQRRSTETVERIVDAAARVFDECGYRRTTTNAIAERAGVSVGSLYQYFPNKDALLVALAERHVEEASEAFRAHLSTAMARGPSLESFTRELIELAVSLHDADRLHDLLAHRAARTPELEARLAQLEDVIVEGVARQLARSGVERSELTARLVVHMVDAAVHDVVIRAGSTSERTTSVDRLVDVLLHGLDG